MTIELLQWEIQELEISCTLLQNYLWLFVKEMKINLIEENYDNTKFLQNPYFFVMVGTQY